MPPSSKSRPRSAGKSKSKKRVPKKPKEKKEKKATELTLANLNEDDTEVDFETLVKEEYMKLHRQYRLMEDARRLIAEKGNNLSKKGKLLELLRAEKEDLVTDLSNAECEAYKTRDEGSIKTILMILENFEKCTADIEFCWKNIQEMESNVDKITKRLVEQRLKVQALYGRSMTVPQSEHRQRVLENRLYHVTTKFDTKVTRNKELREEINMMLKLRGIFFERMIALKRQSNRIKRRMGEIVYLATQAYEARDDYVTKIHVLRDKNEKDSKQHVLEIKEYNRILHNDSKMHGFMSLKNMERILMENNAQRNDRKNQMKLNEIEATLAAYEESFREILQMAQSKDIESIVNNYLEHEQMNFGRFKYITDVNHEINSLREQNITMAKEIEDLYAENKQKEKERQEELNRLSDLYAAENGKLDANIEVWEQAEGQMDEVIRLLDAIFTVASCSNVPIIRLLGNLHGISPRNARLCMKVVESRVGELLFEKAKFEIRKIVEIDKAPIPKKADYRPSGPKPKQAGGPFLPKLTVTGRLDGEQEEEEEDKVFTERPIPYTEMRTRIVEKTARSIAPADKKAEVAAETHVDSNASDESIAVKPKESRANSDFKAQKSDLRSKSQAGGQPL